MSCNDGGDDDGYDDDEDDDHDDRNYVRTSMLGNLSGSSRSGLFTLSRYPGWAPATLRSSCAAPLLGHRDSSMVAVPM
jgi:hypothetical protein